MSIDYTTTANILNIKDITMLPTSQKVFQDVDICRVMSRQLISDIVPLVMNIREEYFVHDYDQAVDTSVSSYAIPSRAVGNKLRDAVLLNSNGKEVSFPRVETDQLKHNWFQANYNLFVNRRGFYFKDDKIIIYPDSSALSAFQLRMKYFRRPSIPILTSYAGQITSIDVLSKTLTLSRMPSSWTTSITYDITNGQPPFTSRGDDLAITSLDLVSKVITFTNTLPTGVVVGDWVSEAGTSPVVQLPFEIHPLLEQRTAIKLLEGIGDTEGVKVCADVYKDMVEKFKTMFTPRADGSPKKVNRGSYLYGDRMFRGNWW